MLVLALVMVALVLAVGATALARAAHARSSAQTAADLAAIAAGQDVQTGGDGCTTAAAVVRANGAGLVSCTVLPGGDVEVATMLAVEPWPGWQTTATASARAGPVR